MTIAMRLTDICHAYERDKYHQERYLLSCTLFM